MIIAGSQDHHVYAWNENGQRLWTSNFASEHAVDSSPAVFEDVVAVGANDGRIYGLDLRNGGKVMGL